MAGFKIELFRGMRPRISALKLSIGESQTAENTDLGSGDARPFVDKATTQAVSAGRSPRTIYLFDNNDDPRWFQWDDHVDVVRGPVKDDSIERTYYTGDTLGNGSPKMTTTLLATNGGDTGPYPEDWVYIGVPAPEVAPIIVADALPEDVPAGARFVESSRTFTDEFVIDKVDFTVHPGTGTDNQTWRLNAAALGSIALDIDVGTAFRVTEIVNASNVKLESASEPGIFARTRNSDKTTVNDWHPMDEQGSTKEADFIGWRIPVGATVRIIGHNLTVGDVISVSAMASPFEFFADLSLDFFEQSWETEFNVFESGSTFKRVTNARVSASSVSGVSPFTISGSFHYDVDRTASDVSELEDRQYVYTYVSDLGEEGPPSPVSAVTPILDGTTTLLSNLSLPPTIGFNITHMRIYRTNSTEAGTEFQFVQEVTVRQTVFETVSSADLGEVLGSTTWDPPAPGMIGITEMPNGMLVGFKGKQLYFCEPFFPHAWPAEYDQAVGHEIVGLAAFGSSITVLTEGHPYLLTGSHPRNAHVRPIKFNQSCSNKESIATDRDKVYYASPDGLVEISVNGIELATEPFLEKEDWASYVPTEMVGSFHEGRYYGFYDFDVSAIDPVISAELSGTISVALESDVINGGDTVIITLTNDTWLEAGGVFNAQRQNIIDGLTAATAQTLGWNNVVRDINLGVSDVVRTSDSVVTITLPANPTYSVTTDEVIAATIPASAVTLSSSAIIAGSTFTITAEVPSASLSIGGSLDANTEASVVAGGETITLTLISDTWLEAGAAFFHAQRQGLIDGLVASTNEVNGWNDVALNEIALTAVVRTSDTVVTITLPAIALYDTTNDESITATVPHTALTTSLVEIASLNSISVLSSAGNPSALFTGTIIGATENEVIAGGRTIIITLVNDTFVAAGAGPIGSVADTQALIDALIATTTQTLGWNNVVQVGIETADVVRTSATVCTITLDAEATYSIASSETIELNIPAEILVTSVPDLTVSNTFGITSQGQITCALTGTVTATIEESAVVTGGKTIILTLTSDTWLPAGTGPIGSTANTQAIIDGITSAQSEGTGWNAVVKVGIETTDLVRTSDTVATITLDPEATYDITAQEVLTATIPAAALNISSLAVVASPTFTVDIDIATSAVQTGTADDSTSADIIVGAKTIILTLTADTWVDSGATFNAIRQDIIDGLDAASSPADAWNTDVRDGTLAVTDVVRTSNTVVTITLPATSTYDINVAEVITATIPASALEQSSIAVVASDTVDITAVSAATSRLMLWHANGLLGFNFKQEISFFDLAHWTSTDGPTGFGAGEFAENAAYSVSEDRWCAIGTDDLLYTSDDFGVNWTVRVLANVAAPPDTVTGIFRTDLNDLWMLSMDAFGSNDHFWEFSADGTTWTDISAAVLFNVSTSGFWKSSGADDRPSFWYGGANHIYAYLQDSANGEPQLTRSENLSTGAITDNWSAAIKSVYAASDPTGHLNAIGSGNGLILALTMDNDDSFRKKLESFSHGGNTFAAGSNFFTDMTAIATLLTFGNDTWVLMNSSGDVWYVDTVGGTVDETDADNWTKVTDIDAAGHNFISLFYDGGTSGTNGQGFIAVAQSGSGSSAETHIYQSADGITWTLAKTFTLRSVTGRAWPERHLDGTDLD